MKSLFSILTVTAFLTISSSAFAGEYALDGYCPVCYLAANKAAKGTTEFKAEYKGQTYLFVNQGALDTFNADPEKYLPEYHGYCAYGMSLGKKFESDPTVFTVKDGSYYLNKDAEIAKLFHKDTADHIAKANIHWAAFGNALNGYCPVCYLAKSVAAKGTTDFVAEHKGSTYLFVSQGALDAFNADPEKYLPEYHGYCAYGMSLGKKFESDPTVFTVNDGRYFLNKDAEIAKLFHKDTAAHIAKADTHWALINKQMMTKGSSAK